MVFNVHGNRKAILGTGRSVCVCVCVWGGGGGYYYSQLLYSAILC